MNGGWPKYVDSALTDFVWGNKHGLNFNRIKGPNDNALAAYNCDRWGYIGGHQSHVITKSPRIPSRNAVFLQYADKNEMQNVEFSFCNARVIKSAKMWTYRELSFHYGLAQKLSMNVPLHVVLLQTCTIPHVYEL